MKKTKFSWALTLAVFCLVFAFVGCPEAKPTVIRSMVGIAIKTQPDKLTYTHGDTFDLAGLEVTLIYDDTTEEYITVTDFTTKNITTSPEQDDTLVHLTHNNQPVTITYNDIPQLAATTNNLTVNPKVITFAVDSILAQTYTGNSLTPDVTVKDNTEILTLNTDYTVEYINNTNAGTATVNVTGTGNYTGSSGSTTFTVIPPSDIDIGSPSVRIYLNGSTIPLTEGGSTQITAGTGTYGVSIATGIYSQIIWYLNGSIVPQWGNRTAVVLTKRVGGTYLVTVETIAGGARNTGTHIFVVE